MENNLNTQELDLSTLSLSEKLESKIWKARKLGLEELKTLLESTDSCDMSVVSKYKEVLSKMPSDTNVVVAEASLDVILIYISKWKLCPKFRAIVLPQLITKCLSSNRSSLSALALEILHVYIELGSGIPLVLEKIFEALTHKTPRVVLSAINAVNSILSAYGSDVLDVKYLLENTVKCFDHKDVSVRKAIANLAAETYRWEGEYVWKMLDDLKSLQVKEIKDAIARVPKEKPAPTRSLRIDKNVGNENTSTEGARNIASNSIIEDTYNDPYENSKPIKVANDPVVLPLLESLDNSDWKVRKESLDNLAKILTVMKIEPDNFWPMIKKLLKKMVDTNINVCASSIECLTSLCLGLRFNFGVYKSQVVAASIEKLKEKRKIVLDPLRELLDSLFLTSSEFISILECLVEGVHHKNPQVRSEVVFWITRSIKVCKGAPDRKTLLSLLEIALKAFTDSEKTVRDHAAELVACLVKISNDNTLLKKISSKLDKQKTSRVMEYLDIIQLNLPCKYEKEDYLRARGIKIYTKPKKRVSLTSTSEKNSLGGCDAVLDRNRRTSIISEKRESDISNSHISPEEVSSFPTHKNQSNELASGEVNATLMVADTAEPFNNVMDVDKEVLQDENETKQFSPIILNNSAKDKQKRTSHVPDGHLIIHENLKKMLKVNSETVFGPEVYSIFANMDNEPESNIIENLEKILQPISQRPESIDYAASQLNIKPEELEERYINASDVLFLTCVSLFSKKIYSITMRCLLLVQTLLFFVESKRYAFTEFEAKILSYSLLTKVSCENNDMSTMVSALFRRLNRSYPDSCIVKYIYEVLTLYPSTRRRCIEELTHLTCRSNEIYYPSELIPVASNLLNEQDQELRDFGESLLDYAYSKIGESLYDYISDAPEITFKLIKNYLTRGTATRLQNDKEAVQSEKISANSTYYPSIPSPQSFSNVNDLENRNDSEPLNNRITNGDVSEKTSNVVETKRLLDCYQPSVPATNGDLSKLPQEMQSILSRLSMSDNTSKINALKDLEKIMADKFNFIPDSYCVILLTTSLIRELKYAVSCILNDENTIGRLCKHLINVLAKIFCCDIVRSLDENSLKQTFIGILDLLLELSFSNAESCQQLSKVLNVLVIRILDNANRTQSFKVLISILREFLMPELQLNPEFADKHKNIAELVMKCLWKITKNIDDLILQKNVDVNQLLFDCHEFLEHIPPIEWKRRSHKKKLFQEELPLKTIKTIMKELIKSLGNDILNYTTLIPYPDQSYAVSYIKQVLKNIKQ